MNLPLKSSILVGFPQIVPWMSLAVSALLASTCRRIAGTFLWKKLGKLSVINSGKPSRNSGFSKAWIEYLKGKHVEVN
jgi:hypothetical protein